MWRKVKQIIQKNQSFLLTTHKNPDGDGVGSACALTELLLQMGKDVQFVCEGPVPEKFAFLDYHGTHKTYDPGADYSAVDVLLVLDTHKLDRIGRVADILGEGGPLPVCIDHHVVHQEFTPNTFVDLRACAVGAMIYTLYKESGFALNLRAAMGIYTSVMSDTGRFSFASTSRKAHMLADECIKVGVDPDEMHRRLYQQVPLAHIRTFIHALERMEMHFEDRVVLQQILLKDFKSTGADFEDLDYIHEFNKAIQEVECGVVLREVPDNQVRVSLRSKGDVDIEKPMKQLGGGGHPKAAGALVQGSVVEVKKRVLDLLSEVFKTQNSKLKTKD